MGSAVLVTGGAGYIGSHAVLALVDRGQPVVVLDDLSTGHTRRIPKGVPFIEGEVADADLVRTVSREFCIWLSATHRNICDHNHILNAC